MLRVSDAGPGLPEQLPGRTHTVDMPKQVPDHEAARASRSSSRKETNVLAQ